jgi:hypothetical protein
MARFIGLKAALAALFLSGTVGVSQAAPVTYADTYWGGNAPNGFGDVVANNGDHRFDITSMTVDRVGNNLLVSIATNYANAVGALGTRLGSLFIGDPTKLNYNGAMTGNGAAPKYANDTFTADTDRFSYAFDYDIANPNSMAIKSGTGSLFALKGNGSDVLLSNANGGFRHNQAVDINGKAKDTGLNGLWSFGSGNVNFTITDFFTLKGLPSTGLTLAWAMSCSNDIILATVAIPGNSTPDVPLPAGLLLFGSGLSGLGFIGRQKRKAVAA